MKIRNALLTAAAIIGPLCVALGLAFIYLPLAPIAIGLFLIWIVKEHS